MPLTEELISQFVKATKDDKQEIKEETVYGTIVEYNDSKYLKIDGSELLTPISSTTNVKDNERVTAMIKNHTVTVTGNLSNPSAGTSEVESVGGKISEFENIIADTVTTKQLEAESARIDDIIAGRIVVSGTLTAESVEIKNLQADNATIKGTLTAQNAEITNLKANSLTAESADLKYANIDFANIGSAAMEYFYAQSGLIKDVVVGDQTITGNLVGVTISGDLIEGNTVVAEKLVIKGEDGLYYKLNTDGMAVEAQQTDYNSINGSVIKAKSITATKISVKDLVAFGATIGGFHITDTSIYSGTKESVGNTTRGIYLDKDGQMAFGDTSNYLKFFKDTDGSYKLAISADSMRLSSGKDIDTAISDLENRIIESGSNVTYVQFDQPTAGMNVGDIWVKAVNATLWNTLKGKTWTEVKNSKWGQMAYSDQPATHVWDGSKWVLTVDYNIVKENSTSIAQTRNEISLKANQTTVDALGNRVTQNSTEIKQTADAITLKADKTETDKIAATVNQHSTEIKQTSDALSLKADWVEVENLIGVVNQHGTAIEQTATNIALKADKTTVDALGKTVSSQGTSISQNASNIALKADKTTVDALGNTVASHTTSIQQNANQIALKANKTDPAGSVSTSTVTVNADGVKIKTGGTFTVDSQKFDIDESGEMSATNARISGQLSVDGHDVWHKGNIIVSTATPSNPVPGTIWVKPDMTGIPAAGTWSHEALSSRPWSTNYVVELSGTSIGAAPSNATYTYEVSVPVYYSHNKTGTCTCTVYLGATSGAQTISMGTQSFNANNAGGNTYKATVTSTTWLGNSGKIYMLVVVSNANMMTVNSYEAFTCTLMAKSTSATGWKACEVQMYVG